MSFKQKRKKSIYYGRSHWLPNSLRFKWENMQSIYCASSTPTTIFIMSCLSIKPHLCSLQGHFLAGTMITLSKNILEPEHFFLSSFLINWFFFNYFGVSCLLSHSTLTGNSQELRALEALGSFFTPSIIVHLEAQ